MVGMQFSCGWDMLDLFHSLMWWVTAFETLCCHDVRRFSERPPSCCQRNSLLVSITLTGKISIMVGLYRVPDKSKHVAHNYVSVSGC